MTNSGDHGTDAGRRKIREARRGLNDLLHKGTIPILTIFVIGGAALVMYNLLRLTDNLVLSAATEGTALYSDALAEVRTLYTSDVVERVRPFGIAAAHDYLDTPSAIPLPATFSMELGRRIGEHGTGMRVRLYSDYPFP